MLVRCGGHPGRCGDGVEGIIDSVTGSYGVAGVLVSILAIIIAGGMSLVYGLGAVGLWSRGIATQAQMAAGFTILVVIGAAKRAFRFHTPMDFAMLSSG